jgi:predicted enzyme related to lactoylglutathione lyase
MSRFAGWFEVPCQRFERATRFYEALLGAELPRAEVSGIPHAFLTAADGSYRGAVIHAPDRKPGAPSGSIHLDAKTHGELRAAVERGWHAGGRVVVPVTSIGAHGFIAIIEDTEGNRVGLHAPLTAATARPSGPRPFCPS